MLFVVLIAAPLIATCNLGVRSKSKSKESTNRHIASPTTPARHPSPTCSPITSRRDPAPSARTTPCCSSGWWWYYTQHRSQACRRRTLAARAVRIITTSLQKQPQRWLDRVLLLASSGWPKAWGRQLVSLLSASMALPSCALLLWYL